jgi:tetratricopeptide (TPR) repeat protein
MISTLFARLLARRPSKVTGDGARDDEVERLRNEAAAAIAEGRLADGESALARAVALGPDRAELHDDLGTVRFRVGDLERALVSYNAALRLAPGFPVGLHAQWGAATTKARLEGEVAGTEAPDASGPIGDELVSIVICSNKRDKYDKVVAHFHERLRRVPHEIVGIHDARSLCEGYNRGVVQSRGSIVVFSHDDIHIVSSDFATKLLDSLAGCDVVGVAGTTLLRGPAWIRSGWPHVAGQVCHPDPDGRLVVTVFGLPHRLVSGAQALDGLLFAARRAVLERVRFDELTFDGWHFYDIDFTFSAFLAGFRLGIRTDLLVRHDSIGNFDERWTYYAQRFLAKHGSNLASRDGGVKPQMVGIKLASDEEWIAVTRHLYQ